jgi:pimeloyl-ACP methyl ester carboxylesterase
MDTHTVTGGGGITLEVDETGRPDGPPILFIHGYTQSRRSWDHQLYSGLAEEFRLVAIDNRGHGGSEKPEDAYGDSTLWADDVQAVIDQLGLDRPVLVGWSYGGLIVTDYLATHGTDDIGGVNYVGAISKLGTDAANAVVGQAFFDRVSGFVSRDTTETVAALSAFLEDCVHGSLSARDRYYLLGFNVVCPPHVRASLLDREVSHDDVLAALDLPVLFTHGEEDRIVLPAACEEHAELVPNGEKSYYADVGHAPFWEAPERFNRELQAFVDGR